MAKRKESHGEIDWASAEVQDSALTVPIGGEPSKAWAERVGEVIERLGSGGGWGTIAVKRDAISVKDVQPGAEADLRHLLESAVMQANADFAPAEPDSEEGEGGGDPADEEMAGTFRAFAPDEREGDDEGDE